MKFFGITLLFCLVLLAGSAMADVTGNNDYYANARPGQRQVSTIIKDGAEYENIKLIAK